MIDPHRAGSTGVPRDRPTLIVPVKRLTEGKSRLRAAAGATDDLVLAIALDTIGAALGAAPVLVVTNDPAVRTGAIALGARTVPDRPDTGLNAAIAYGETVTGTGAARGALLADLPALRVADLVAAVETGTGRRAFVTDRAGTGTTLLLAPPGVPLDPRFGPGSAMAHAASGALPLPGAWPSLRQDVDTPADLDAARALGLGRRTAGHLVARAGGPRPLGGRP